MLGNGDNNTILLQCYGFLTDFPATNKRRRFSICLWWCFFFLWCSPISLWFFYRSVWFHHQNNQESFYLVPYILCLSIIFVSVKYSENLKYSTFILFTFVQIVYICAEKAINNKNIHTAVSWNHLNEATYNSSWNSCFILINKLFLAMEP